MSITIETSDYNVLIGENAIFKIKKYIDSHTYSKIFILVDENIRIHCLPILLLHLKNIDDYHVIQIQSGEEHKTIMTCSYVWEKLSELGADRKSLLVNLGGGVIGDMGGFIASTFKRGIDFINIPTTLLAQVDASVGGKLGIDLNNLKNQVGLFANPKAVFIFPGFLNTLPLRQLLSGYAEIIKHALIADPDYWQEIQNKDLFDEKNYFYLISNSIKIKNEIVKIDPQEKGIRKSLNFGHTIGHALETFSMMADKSPLFHGEAVAAGIICESYLSSKFTGLSQKELKEISDFISAKFNYYQIENDNVSKIINLMNHDKKNENQNINFTFINRIGSVIINQNCLEKDILEAFDFYRKIYQK